MTIDANIIFSFSPSSVTQDSGLCHITMRLRGLCPPSHLPMGQKIRTEPSMVAECRGVVDLWCSRSLSAPGRPRYRGSRVLWTKMPVLAGVPAGPSLRCTKASHLRKMTLCMKCALASIADPKIIGSFNFKQLGLSILARDPTVAEVVVASAGVFRSFQKVLLSSAKCRAKSD